MGGAALGVNAIEEQTALTKVKRIPKNFQMIVS